jgi:hypothetical protein
MVGNFVGGFVGLAVGAVVGDFVGGFDGAMVGKFVGGLEGAFVGSEAQEGGDRPAESLVTEIENAFVRRNLLDAEPNPAKGGCCVPASFGGRFVA